jgi:hypothetical protein
MQATPVLRALCVLFLLCLFAESPLARTWYVKVNGTGDAPTIQAAIDLAQPDDVVLLAAGRYTWANQGGGETEHGMVHIKRNQIGFTLRGESGAGATIIDAQRQGRVFFIDGWNDIEIEGLTITGGLAPEFGDRVGGGIAIHLTHDVIRDCIFENNEARNGAGIWVAGHSTLRLENCVFRYNTATERGGGMFYAGSTLPQNIVDCVAHDNAAARGGGLWAGQVNVTIENTAFVNNVATQSGGGFYGYNMWPSVMRGCTISSNEAPDGSAVYFITGATPLPFERTIFSFNGPGDPISLNSGATISIGCSDIFGNPNDNLPADVIDNGGNFSADPSFCNPPSWPEPTLSNNSPCAPGNHPEGWSCGVIGARNVACGTVPIERRTWGHIKSLFE